MEYLEGGTISQLVKDPIKPRYISYIAKEMLKALSFLHTQHIGHCDIKPDNGK